MAQSNILITDNSEMALMKINLKLLEKIGKKYKNKTELINASILIASECMEFMDSESISEILNKDELK